MKIIIVEDDYLQSEWLETSLKEEFKNLELLVFNTELSFRKNIDQIIKFDPNIIIIDIMLRWTNPGPNIEKPSKEIEEEGFYHAGFRCQQLLVGHNKNFNIIFYTVLSKDDLEDKLKNLPSNLLHLQKEGDIRPLLELIKKIVN